jgi:hypothetical protein
MCRPTKCKTCAKTTWAGCGRHIDQVKASVPADRWCPGHTRDTGSTSPNWVRRLLGR